MVHRPINSALKREYHLQIKEYLISENFKYNVIGDLGCGYAYPTLDFSIIDNKKLFLFDGYSEDNEQFYFTKQEIKEFYTKHSSEHNIEFVNIANKDTCQIIDPIDVWVSIMSVGLYINPAEYKEFIHRLGSSSHRFICTIFKDNPIYNEHIEIVNIIADKTNNEDCSLASEQKQFDVVLAEVKFN